MLLTASAHRARKQLRDYQADRVAEAVSFLRAGKSPVIQAATGTGKTRIGAEIVSRANEIFGDGAGVLWFVHRRELVYQARDAIEEATDQQVGIEMGPERSRRLPLVVASKDSIRRAARLATIHEPSLLVIDECHHAEADTYLSVCQAFPRALRLGLSATPFRLDKRSLSSFDCATVPYGISQAIHDGWLVPFDALRVRTESIDISGVRAVAGDLSEKDMALIVQQDSAVGEITCGVLKHYERRPTIVFCPDVKSANLICNDLNERAGWLVARTITQETSLPARQTAIRTFGQDYLVLVNVGVATEGVDLPRAEVIALARLTLSQSLYIQMVGRGLRPLPGIDGAEDRHAWIAQSAKPRCLILDFVGNCGRHSIASAAAMFGDVAIDNELRRAAVARVGKMLENSATPISVMDAIEAEERAIAHELSASRLLSDDLRAKVKGKPIITLTSEVADVIGMLPDGEQPATELATAGQLEQLLEFGVDIANPDGTPVTRAAASSEIARQRKNRSLATPRQIAFIQKHYKHLHLDAHAVAVMTSSDARGMIVKKLRAWGQAR